MSLLLAPVLARMLMLIMMMMLIRMLEPVV
jgi:hypothetical protein